MLTPEPLPGELEGDFFRRKAGFFLRIALLAAAALFILILAAFLWHRIRGEWPVLILGVPGFMLAALALLAPVATYYSLVQSLSRPRTISHLLLDRLLYGSA